MLGPELSKNNISIKKGKDIVIEPELVIFRIAGAFLIATPSDWGWDDEEVLPHIELFPLGGDSRKHQLDRMVNLLYEIMWILGPINNKHERYNINIAIEDRDSKSITSGIYVGKIMPNDNSN